MPVVHELRWTGERAGSGAVAADGEPDDSARVGEVGSPRGNDDSARTGLAGRSRVLLTYKGAAADEESGSKPESETTAGDAGTLDAILIGLGYVHLVAFEKHCTNYTFTVNGRRMLATLVTVPELDGTFLEVETIADDRDLEDALRAVRQVMAELGIGAADLTTEQYTEAVLAARSGH